MMKIISVQSSIFFHLSLQLVDCFSIMILGFQPLIYTVLKVQHYARHGTALHQQNIVILIQVVTNIRRQILLVLAYYITDCKNCSFNFWKFPGPKFSGKENILREAYWKFLEISYPEFPFRVVLLQKFPEFSVDEFAFRKFNNFEGFP